MNNSKHEKTDVISAILESNELLNAFSKILDPFQMKEEPKSMRIQENHSSSLGRIHKLRIYLWKKVRDALNFISAKMQTLAVLTEYHFRNEIKKGVNMVIFKNGLPEKDGEDHPDITHIPNDQPIPDMDPNKRPVEIPMREPTNPPIPGPIETPIKDPNKKPGIRVLNVEL